MGPLRLVVFLTKVREALINVPEFWLTLHSVVKCWLIQIACQVSPSIVDLRIFKVNNFGLISVRQKVVFLCVIMPKNHLRRVFGRKQLQVLFGERILVTIIHVVYFVNSVENFSLMLLIKVRILALNCWKHRQHFFVGNPVPAVRAFLNELKVFRRV